MVGCFPDPEEDEIVYSMCARFRDRMDYSSNRSIVQELFSSGNVVATLEFPSHLSALVANLSPRNDLTVDYLIDKHTLLPLFSPFLPLERVKRIREDMAGDRGLAIHMRVGLMASQLHLPEWIRYCPVCLEADKANFKESYWRRTHQATGVEVCPIHHVMLENGITRKQVNHPRYRFISAETAAQVKPARPSNTHIFGPMLEMIAQDVAWLLNQNLPPLPFDSFKDRYLWLLSDRGLVTHRTRLRIRELVEEFKAFYQADFLKLLNCQIEENVTENWLLRLIRSEANAHSPVRHLLLMHFLECTAEEFFNLAVEEKPFGNAPWPCLNFVCQSHPESVILTCDSRSSPYVEGKPIGTFACPCCGYVYARTGPDLSEDDKYKPGKIVAFGPVWDAKLKELWLNPEVSLREIGRQLDVDPRTVKRHAARLGLLFPRPGRQCSPLRTQELLRSEKSKAVLPDVLLAHQTEWLTLRAENPNASITQLRHLKPGLYSWFYRNDRNFLERQKPERRKRVKEPVSRVDWAMRDEQLAVAVKPAVSRLKKRPGRPVQITISAIGRELGQLGLIQQHLDKLPLTAQVLKEVVETREAYGLRRIEWAIEQYRQECTRPKRWDLIKRAGVERLASYPQIRDAINEGLQALNI